MKIDFLFFPPPRKKISALFLDTATKNSENYHLKILSNAAKALSHNIMRDIQI